MSRTVSAQSAAPAEPRAQDSTLTALIARATAVSPRLRASGARITAAQSRIGPAGSRPDPVLITGLQNFPVFRPGFTDEMTMKMIGVSQTLPFAGKQRLRRDAAVRDTDAMSALDLAARAELIVNVKTAWYELAWLDAALAVADRDRALSDDIAALALTRYDAGAGSQADVLTARVTAAKRRDDIAGLRAERVAALAGLNAMLDRPGDTPIAAAALPSQRTRGLIVDELPVLESRAASTARVDTLSPFLPLQVLQERAAQSNPTTIAQQRTIDAQAVRVSLARAEYRPDIDVSVQYGQRQRLPDMLTVQVAIPLRLQQRVKQAQSHAEARAEFAALEADRDLQRVATNVEIARLLSQAERLRAQLLLYTSDIQPQSSAGIAAALTNYRGSTGTLAQVLLAQSSALENEMTMARSRAMLARTVAALELAVGTEVLR